MTICPVITGTGDVEEVNKNLGHRYTEELFGSWRQLRVTMNLDTVAWDPNMN